MLFSDSPTAWISRGSSGRSHLGYRAAAQLLALLERGLPEHRAVEVALVNKFLPTDPELFSAARLKNSISTAADPDAPTP